MYFRWGTESQNCVCSAGKEKQMHLWIRQSRLDWEQWGMRTLKRVSLLLAAKGPPTTKPSSTINATRTSATILQLCTSLRFLQQEEL